MSNVPRLAHDRLHPAFVAGVGVREGVMGSLSDRIHNEAATSSRPGQFQRLEAIADEVERLEARVARRERGGCRHRAHIKPQVWRTGYRETCLKCGAMVVCEDKRGLFGWRPRWVTAAKS